MLVKVFNVAVMNTLLCSARSTLNSSARFLLGGRTLYTASCIMTNRPYDITVYGASGFTGQYVAAEAFRTRQGKRIAIAGRNKSKLEKVLQFIKEEVGVEDDEVLSQVGIVVADNNNDSTIMEMCRQCKVVINCVGPYAFYGEQVVRACVETGTHHVDISGEPAFLQMCQLKYHDLAREKAVHVVGTCGFDSVPADIGLETLRERFPGELTFAESFIHLYARKANTGTYDSLVNAVVESNIAREQIKLIFKEKLNYTGPRVKQSIVHWNKSQNRYAIPFMGPDASVVKRTQLYESSVHQKTPIQYLAYLTTPTIIHLMAMFWFGLSVALLTKFQMGINLLLRFPGFFSFGMFSSDGVSKEELYKSGFKVVFHGKGYKEKPDSSSVAGPTDQSMTLTFKGPDPGYIYTSISIVAAATTLLDDQLLNKGGVLTPGSAFRGTRFVERLQERGVKITTS